MNLASNKSLMLIFKNNFLKYDTVLIQKQNNVLTILQIKQKCLISFLLIQFWVLSNFWITSENILTNCSYVKGRHLISGVYFTHKSAN